MRYILSLLLLSSLFSYSQEKYLTPFEKGNGNQTATYEELIAFYKILDTAFETVKMVEIE